jgi:chlorite dismutase
LAETPRSEAAQKPRQFVSYTFYRVQPEWRRLDEETRRRGKQEFAAVVDEFAASIFVRSYSLVGMRGDCDFMLWTAAHELEIFNRLEGELNGTGLGRYVERPHSFLAGLRRSMYLPETAGGDRHGTGSVKAAGHRYLFIYPFVKRRDWYKLTRAARQGMMNEHFAIGNRYPEFEVNTAYSFGLDDQEFVVSFEGDDAHRFVDLVMELRDSEASAYTLRDTPTFTCIRTRLEEALELVG